MWHGRERLAQAHYRKALNRFSSGAPDKALWHVHMALHCHPRFLPAVRLKEKILGQREWDEDANLGRSLLHRLIARQKGYDLRPFGRPAPASTERDQRDAPIDGERDETAP